MCKCHACKTDEHTSHKFSAINEHMTHAQNRRSKRKNRENKEHNSSIEWISRRICCDNMLRIENAFVSLTNNLLCKNDSDFCIDINKSISYTLNDIWILKLFVSMCIRTQVSFFVFFHGGKENWMPILISLLNVLILIVLKLNLPTFEHASLFLPKCIYDDFLLERKKNLGTHNYGGVSVIFA